jgi:hypothetical protein
MHCFHFCPEEPSEIWLYGSALDYAGNLHLKINSPESG